MFRSTCHHFPTPRALTQSTSTSITTCTFIQKHGNIHKQPLLCKYQKVMRVFVYLVEGKEWAVRDSFVKLKVGRCRGKTRIVKNTNDPVWDEEFVFRVDDVEEELVLSVYEFHGHSGFFNAGGDLVGRVRIPLSSVAAEENHHLPPTWFSVEKHRSFKSAKKDCGKILLSLSLRVEVEEMSADHLLFVHPNDGGKNKYNEVGDHSVSSEDNLSSTASAKKTLEGKHLMKAIAGRFERIFHKHDQEVSETEVSPEVSTTLSADGDSVAELATDSSFEELLEMMQSKNEDNDVPENLQGGVLLDQMYAISPSGLNILIFGPDSQLQKNLAEINGTTDYHERPWKWKSAERSCITRVVTYTKGATKLVKAVKATEEQTYLRANGKEFAVFVDVSTPDVPYGSTFKVNLLYKIEPGQELPSGEESAHLVVSWTVNFHQSTMMKGMIEGGVKQGLRESFDQLSGLLSKDLKVINPESVLDKEHTVATLMAEQQSAWKTSVAYFFNLTVISSVFMVLYVGFHIWKCGESKLQGLEFDGLDLPDSIGEIITSGILVIQLQRVFSMMSHFVQARLEKGRDRGVKAQGDGWVLTIALIEASGLASLESTGFPDPYVVFTCNGKTRTSSVKLQTVDPHWNEILEFDASEPPSVLDVEVFDFDGPFDQDTSLGHAEINFLKHNSTELADIWVPLQGKLAQSSQSKLHLRIFLDNNGVETIRDYLSKMEKEVGKKLNLRSPHRNSAFQKVFGLPPEEFLISDFSCSLKRKLPLQGRLFLSARIIGFYANLFGHKTKFFFLWEDIDDIQELPPSFGTVGSPSLVIILGKGRGIDARHGARCMDEEGRLHFCFHSFVTFNVASRTILALWRTRTLTPEQRAEIAEENQDRDEKATLVEETGSSMIKQDAIMTKVLSVEVPLTIRLLMERFDGEEFEYKVMSNSGCLNYITTPWETMAPDEFERRVSFKFDRGVSIFGGDVTCTQRKIQSTNGGGGGWIIDEVMTLHDVPFSDYFRVKLRYQVENSSVYQGMCVYEVYIGVAWLKSTKFEERVTRNVVGKLTRWSKELLRSIQREILLAST